MTSAQNKPDSVLKEFWERQMQDAARAASPLQEKILLFALLDAMARPRFPREQERERVIRFFETCSRWEGRWKVSLLQLQFHMEAMFSDAERRESRLWSEVERRLAKTGGRPEEASDPSLMELEPLATLEECGALGRTKYSSLFEAYRRETLAAFREPEAAEGPRLEARLPYYRNAEGAQHLVFPLKFLRELCREGILKMDGETADFSPRT